MPRVALFEKPNEIKIVERKKPNIKENEVLIKVAYAGICNTDLEIFNGEYIIPKAPLVLGHEFTGEVVELGSPEYKAILGKRVTAEINNTCLAYRRRYLCPACRTNLDNHCLKRTVLGIVKSDGAFAQYIKVPIGNVHVLPENVSLKEGVFIETLAAAIQTFEMAPITIGNLVVVFGVGKLGLLILSVARHLGARVIAVSRSRKKLDFARRFGADFVLTPQDDIRRLVDNLTEDLGADVVVESSGDPQNLEKCLEVVKPRGTIVLKTTTSNQAKNIDTTKIVLDEIKIIGSRCGPFPKAMNMIASKMIDVNRLISEVYPLTKIDEAFEAAKEKFKILIDCQK
ncbi:MAG: zinc-binding dehydrogenase [Candidatus Helarchaeota archaeon]